MASLGEFEIISNRSGIAKIAHIIGNKIIATKTCTTHHDSHDIGFIYFMPKPKVPWKKLAKIKSKKGKNSSITNYLAILILFLIK